MASSQTTLRKLFAAHRSSLALTYFLTFLENLFVLLYPYTLGVAIDGLLAGAVWSVAPFVGTWLAHLAVGTSRKIYDTHTFTRIYGGLATEVVRAQRASDVPSSTIVARSTLAREFVGFFERDVPLVFGSLFGFFGALVMLAVYDWQISLYCLALHSKQG